MVGPIRRNERRKKDGVKENSQKIDVPRNGRIKARVTWTTQEEDHTQSTDATADSETMYK